MEIENIFTEKKKNSPSVIIFTGHNTRQDIPASDWDIWSDGVWSNLPSQFPPW